MNTIRSLGWRFYCLLAAFVLIALSLFHPTLPLNGCVALTEEASIW